jgi:hypothetical protein
MHKVDNIFEGYSILNLAQDIRNAVEHYQCKSILDYGSGKGRQYSIKKVHEKYFNNVLPDLYDPAVEGIDILPNKIYDMVLSTDVLEHVHPSYVDYALDEIFSRASKVVYLGICTRNATKLMPNNENCHLTVRDFDWWVEKLVKYKVDTCLQCYEGSVGTAYIVNGNVVQYIKRK